MLLSLQPCSVRVCSSSITIFSLQLDVGLWNLVCYDLRRPFISFDFFVPFYSTFHFWVSHWTFFGNKKLFFKDGGYLLTDIKILYNLLNEMKLAYFNLSWTIYKLRERNREIKLFPMNFLSYLVLKQSVMTRTARICSRTIRIGHFSSRTIEGGAPTQLAEYFVKQLSYERDSTLRVRHYKCTLRFRPAL